MRLNELEQVAQSELEHLLKKSKAILKFYDEEIIKRAFWRSFYSHQNQFRASGELYYKHPLAVAHIMLDEIPLDSVSIAAALLHDVVEDYKNYSIADMEVEFGKEVTIIVDGLTKISEMFANREIKEAENFRKMLLTMVADVRTILIKFCDRLHNMRTLGSLPPHRQVKIATQSRDIYALLAHRFGLFRIKTELEDLAFKYLNPDDYKSILKKLNELHSHKNSLEEAIVPISNILKENKYEFEISARQKGLYSIYRKIIQKNKELNKLYDIYGVRIILKNADPSACYSVYGLITYRLFKPIPERFKDYISRPKKNGYQSLHAALLNGLGQVFEIQIRTENMHLFAENGIAAHWRYKEGRNQKDANIDKMIEWVKELLESDESSESFMEAFRMNLEHNDIYIFTPKGDVRTLPKSSTVLDFAFEIHSQIGATCIGAKVNGKTVSIRQELTSGDQVEIITSKNQKPNLDWEKYVVTNKAKSKIRQSLNEDRRKLIEEGRLIWKKSLTKKNLKTLDNENDCLRIARFCGRPNTSELFILLAEKKKDVGVILDEFIRKTTSNEERKFHVEPLANKHNTELDGYIKKVSNAPIIIDGSVNGIAYEYARCCNPVPGDLIIGMVTKAGAVKIHRRSCKNVNSASVVRTNRLITANWNVNNIGLHHRFITSLRVSGFDRMGLTNELTNLILKSKVNIKSISLNATETAFNGSITIYVEDLEELNVLVANLKKIEGIEIIERDAVS
ncbi:hypothetical protein CHS0354_000710 [Potamilus streckersoni]|uniref:Putative GTP diphosphokinase RSH1, chloroplastic n=1 Tax=Potamilus streckersoni TaxID=2493646 RepID=A0AAE0T820_9BIVA|nr:hypothetical protein CHS0354_000710 [Potamilus streckersoni]